MGNIRPNRFQNFRQFLQRDPVLTLAGVLGSLSMFLVPPDSDYRHYLDFKVLICLLALMLSVELFQAAHLFAATAAAILNRVNGLRRLTLVLTGLTFVAAMFLTNDVALITLVPLSLLIFRLLDDKNALIRVIVLQTIAANVGSALTPIGNPQNLFLFSHYQMAPLQFFAAVWPVGLTGAVLLVILIFRSPNQSLQAVVQPVRIWRGRDLLLAGLLFIAAVACVFGLFSEWLLLGVTLLLLAPFRPRILLKADYGLLLTFVFFFLIIGNISRIPALRNFFAQLLDGPQRVILAGALLSQIISNVPAAILLSGFTDQASQLLRGVNAGGCGTLIASLASVISFKLFSRTAENRGDGNAEKEKKRYLLVFSGYNAVFLAMLVLVSFII